MRMRLPARLAAMTLVVASALSASSCGDSQAGPDPYRVMTAEEIKAAVAGMRGEVVVLNLWATWCEPCREEFPALAELSRRYADRGVRVVGVSVDYPDEVESKIRPFVEEVGAEFPIWVKAEGDPMEFMRALQPELSGALPETIIYDRDGAFVRILSGEQTLEQFEEAVEEVL